MKMKSLRIKQELAVRYMASRQLRRWPETKFRMTKSETHADHPACGGTNHLYINRTTAIALTDQGICVMNEKEDRVWLSPGAMQLISIGNEIARDR